MEASKKMLADSGQGSFLKSESEKAAEDIFATPSPDKRKISSSNGGEGTIEVLATGDGGDAEKSHKSGSEKPLSDKSNGLNELEDFENNYQNVQPGSLVDTDFPLR